jgi:hypothetical protein
MQIQATTIFPIGAFASPSALKDCVIQPAVQLAFSVIVSVLGDEIERTQILPEPDSQDIDDASPSRISIHPLPSIHCHFRNSSSIGRPQSEW